MLMSEQQQEEDKKIWMDGARKSVVGKPTQIIYTAENEEELLRGDKKRWNKFEIESSRQELCEFEKRFLYDHYSGKSY